MAYRLNYKQGPKMAVAEISALLATETAEPVLQELRDRTLEHGDKRLLINLLDVPGTLGPKEHQAMGLLVVRYLGHMERVASLVPEEKITRVSEAAAQAAGLQLRVFGNLTEAVDWLVEED